MCWWRHFFSCINNTELNWIFFPILLQRFQTCQESSSSRWESLMSKALTSPVYAQAAARCSLWYARWCLPWGDAEPCIFSHSGGWEVQLQTSVWRANATLIPLNCCILQYCTGLLMHSMGLKKKTYTGLYLLYIWKREYSCDDPAVSEHVWRSRPYCQRFLKSTPLKNCIFFSFRTVFIIILAHDKCSFASIE